MFLSDALEDYLLTHDLADGSEDYYRRTVGVFTSWNGRNISKEEFTTDTVNRFIRDKQQAGRSSHYCRSLRNGLRALLRHIHGDCGKLRPVRCKELLSDTWTPEEVGRLADAANDLRMRRTIWGAYYTGLSQCDLWRLERQHVTAGGVIHFARQKTGKRVVVAIPLDLLAELPTEGRLFPLDFSEEWFRRLFANIVKKAGLCGTFKKLRRSSGTAIEMLHPGRGHVHLGNTREIFEKHYWDRQRDCEPMMPPRPNGDRPAA